MNKLLCEYDGINSTSEAYIRDNVKTYEMLGIECIFKDCRDITKEDIESCDIFSSLRPYSIDSYYNAKAAKDAGCMYSVFYDDDLLTSTVFYPKRRDYAIKCLELADTVGSTSPLIAEEYCKYTKGAKSILYNTLLSEEDIMTVETPPQDDKIHIIFAAGTDHDKIFTALIGPIFEKLFEINENIDFTFFGVHPELKNFKYMDRVSFIPSMPLKDYTKYMRTHHFDIGIAPLEDSHFCNRKYFNKFIEYSKVGICGIYSNCKPYTYVVKDGENGLLSENTPEAWLKTICKCVENDLLRKEMVNNAQKLLRTDFSLSKIEEITRENYPELWTFVKEPKPFNFKKEKLKFKTFYLKDKIWRFFNIAKTDGLSKAIKTTADYLKK